MNYYGKYDSSGIAVRLLELSNRYDKPIPFNFRRQLPHINGSERATHQIHPYPAKLLVHIPIFFLSNEIFSKPGDIVLDPFSGSGTVLLEAQLSGRNSIGADINPFARLLTKTKVTPINISKLKATKKRLFEWISSIVKYNLPMFHNLEYWFYPHVIDQLSRIRESIYKIKNLDYRDFFLVCLSNCANNVSLADPRIYVPVRLRYDKYPEDHPLKNIVKGRLDRLKRINVIKHFDNIVEKNLIKFKNANISDNSFGAFLGMYNDARDLKKNQLNQPIKDDSVQLIITSPPYPGAQKYIRASTFSLGWLGLIEQPDFRKLKSNTIGREEVPYLKKKKNLPNSNIEEFESLLENIFIRNPKRANIAAIYIEEMKTAFREMNRVLKHGGFLVLIVGNNQIAGYEFPNSSFLSDIAKNVDLKLVLHLEDAIKGRSLLTKRNGGSIPISHESVLVFKK